VTPLSLLLPLAFFFQSPRTFTIAGILVNGVTGAPIAKAKVSLGSNPSIVTGPDGRFRFDGLEAGEYSLRAERLGYVTQAFGQRVLYTNFSSGIVVGENEPTQDLIFRMIPSSVIAGYVIDANGYRSSTPRRSPRPGLAAML
jgi:hypothetical protein